MCISVYLCARVIPLQGGNSDNNLPVIYTPQNDTLRLSDKILILGNGGVKNTRTYDEDDTLKGYVMTLQKFEKLLKKEEKKGSVKVSTSEIITNKTFKL